MAVVAQTFEPKGFDLFSSNQPTLLLSNGTTIPISGYQFTATSQVMYRRFTAVAYSSGNVTCRIRWYSSSTSGNAQFSAAIAAITPGDAQSVLTKALATATTTTTAVGGTASMINTTDVTVSNLDSLAADDEVWIAVTRAASTTVASGPVVVSVEVIYASTAGVGSGNVSNAGGSTDNAIARFDLATGQVIQNSGVIVDDSNNVTGVVLLNELTPRFIDFARLTSAFTSSGTTAQTITGTSISFPSAGTYIAEYDLIWQVSTTSAAMSFGILATGGTISAFAASGFRANSGSTFSSGAVSTNGGQINATSGGIATSDQPARYWATFAATAAGTAVLQCQKATSGTITVQIGSYGKLFKIA